MASIKCKGCGKTFMHESSLIRHSKTCKVKPAPVKSAQAKQVPKKKTETVPVRLLRRLTEAGALELAIALGQWFYYEKDDPIFTDQEYDTLEKRYKRYLKESKSPGGIMPGILDKPGSGDTIRQLLLLWRE